MAIAPVVNRRDFLKAGAAEVSRSSSVSISLRPHSPIRPRIRKRNLPIPSTPGSHHSG